MSEDTLVIVQTCTDGETWQNCGKPMPENEAVALKHGIDHNGPSCGIDVRIVPA